MQGVIERISSEKKMHDAEFKIRFESGHFINCPIISKLLYGIACTVKMANFALKMASSHPLF